MCHRKSNRRKIYRYFSLKETPHLLQRWPARQRRQPCNKKVLFYWRSNKVPIDLSAVEYSGGTFFDHFSIFEKNTMYNCWYRNIFFGTFSTQKYTMYISWYRKLYHIGLYFLVQKNVPPKILPAEKSTSTFFERWKSIPHLLQGWPERYLYLSNVRLWAVN